MSMATEYQALVDAAKAIGNAMSSLSMEDGITYTSPAYKMLHHAQTYVNSLAEQELRFPVSQWGSVLRREEEPPRYGTDRRTT